MALWLCLLMTMTVQHSTQNVYQFWVVLVFGAHMLCVVLLLRFVPAKASKRAWAKLRATCAIRLCGCLSLRIPGFTDMSLLAACLLWPPACFVSDATDAQGLLGALAHDIPQRQSHWTPMLRTLQGRAGLCTWCRASSGPGSCLA